MDLIQRQDNKLEVLGSKIEKLDKNKEDVNDTLAQLLSKVNDI